MYPRVTGMHKYMHIVTVPNSIKHVHSQKKKKKKKKKDVILHNKNESYAYYNIL